MTRKELYKFLLFGVAIGDALGVPVEFKSRKYLKKNPIPGMICYFMDMTESQNNESRFL